MRTQQREAIKQTGSQTRATGLLVHRSLVFRLTSQTAGLNCLETKFQPKLKLPRIEGRCRPAIVTTVPGALLKGVDVIDET